ncbi:flavin reductase family protein [Deinococcus radiopugnans]|uniref:Flavin reductase (DIM6/NTAB) family NADH-FMN oxidoreductase RutF n=1 Tax=Deinococcus radiopugnans ATCC 19172 TaxID=585398 RepID=A0A5C4Y9A6_9DEIO|nr:flavin reductase family protein [Deinococcus radiopugnans]MBB6016081.1 flavin reductase (DIM6/NTAB) family NADH-FMN oxidoreductase RutF [Deinococcus radiopugnans ATCC 19172]QLG11237.1 flavin reductase family protein [Deinococcus sp. D7000]TNM72110.1 flavin reductase family protein [Deinococcus radiopugnans ATCC 19172]
MTSTDSTAGAQAGVTPLEFRETLGRFASGVTVITASDGETRRGMTASAFVSVSLTPPLILVSVDHRAHMYALLSEDRVTHFGVNVLSSAQRHLSDHFAGRPGPEEAVPWFAHEGLPLIGGSVAQLVCRKQQVIPAGDHTLYLGFVEYSRYTDDDPLLYFRGQYHELG